MQAVAQHFDFGWTTKDGLHLYAPGWQPQVTPRVVVRLVHGLGEHSGRYVHLANHLNRAGYAVEAILRICGQWQRAGAGRWLPATPRQAGLATMTSRQENDHYASNSSRRAQDSSQTDALLEQEVGGD